MYSWEMEADIAYARYREMQKAEDEKRFVPTAEEKADPKSQYRLCKKAYNYYQQNIRLRNRCMEVEDQLIYNKPSDPSDLKKLQQEYDELRGKILVRCEKVWNLYNNYKNTRARVFEDAVRKEMKIRIPLR